MRFNIKFPVRIRLTDTARIQNPDIQNPESFEIQTFGHPDFKRHGLESGQIQPA